MIAGMGGEVYATRPRRGFEATPSIRIYQDHVYMTLDIRFKATSPSGCTAQSSGQEEGIPQ
jgi:hypothetical protein